MLAIGGPGKEGVVQSIGNSPDGKSWRSCAMVKWDSAGTMNYRLGHDGYVDIKYQQPSYGYEYYVDQLPTLGEHWMRYYYGKVIQLLLLVLR